jgi:fibronectin-binding autotransporter adhesin
MGHSLSRGAVMLMIAALITLSTTACGGGGGGGGGGGSSGAAVATTADFTGTYCLFGLRITPAPLTPNSLWGNWAPDGMGTIVAGSLSENNDGTVNGPNSTGDGMYTISSTGGMTWHDGGPPTFSGGLAAGGSFGGMTVVKTGSNPAIMLTTKKAGTFSNASLSGTYHAMMFFQSGADMDGTAFGTAEFDGVGGSTLNIRSNTDGTTAIVGTVTPSYTVAADGAMTWAVTTANVEGCVINGGDVVVLAGATNADDIQILGILIKAGSGLTQSVLNGAYHVVGIVAENSGTPKIRTTTTTASADGIGSVTLNAGTMNADGTVGPSMAGASPFAVSINGTLIAGSLQGGVSQDGKVAALAGGTSGGEDPEFWVLFK